MIDAKYLGLTANQLTVTASKLEAENKKLREFALMMLLVCKNQGIVGGVFARPDANRNLMDEYVEFESRARELGIEAKK